MKFFAADLTYFLSLHLDVSDEVRMESADQRIKDQSELDPDSDKADDMSEARTNLDSAFSILEGTSMQQLDTEVNEFSDAGNRQNALTMLKHCETCFM